MIVDTVLFIQQRIPHYRTRFFADLALALRKEGIALRVAALAGSIDSADRKDEGDFPPAIITRGKLVSFLSRRVYWVPTPKGLHGDNVIRIVPHEIGSIASWYWLLRRPEKTMLFGHGRNFQAKRNGAWDRLTRWAYALMARRAALCFAYTSTSATVIAEYGVDPYRIAILNNSKFTANRQRKDLATGKTIAFLGSLTREKRFDFLFDAVDQLRGKHADLEFVIVGDGPMRETVERFTEKRSWARWVGAVDSEALAPVISDARCILSPGMVGLNLIDSFALGIPLVTTDRVDHSPEIAYLRSKVNGVVANDSIGDYVRAVDEVLVDAKYYETLVGGCYESATTYSLDRMVSSFKDSIKKSVEIANRAPEQPAGSTDGFAINWRRYRATVVFVWRRVLPYHAARLRHATQFGDSHAIQVIGLEIASSDASYEGIGARRSSGLARITLFPQRDYHSLTSTGIQASVYQVLSQLRPDVVFSPATAFPEGMAAIRFRTDTGCRVVVMDDAWERSDIRGPFTRVAKTLIHQNVDAAFVPASSHTPYFERLGFPLKRQIFGCDVVDNEFFASVQRNDQSRRFLYVGRDVPHKGIDDLLDAYRRYCNVANTPWALHLIGPIRERAPSGIPETLLRYRGALDIAQIRDALAETAFLVVPSRRETWGLVVNEAMAAAVPVIASDAVGASDELIRKTGAGFVFPTQDVKALTACLLAASSLDIDSYGVMSASARSAVQKFSLSRYSEAIESALALSRRGAASFPSQLLMRAWRGRIVDT